MIQHFAAGGVVYYKFQDEIKYLILCQQRNSLKWILPKGHIEPQETTAQGAIREVEEESGLKVGNPLACLARRVHYYTIPEEDMEVHEKEVVWYLFTTKDTKVVCQATEDLITYKWATYQTAQELLTHQDEKEVVTQADRLCRAIV